MATFIARFASAGRPGGPVAASPTRVAVKDLLDLEGAPTTSGSRVLAGKARPASGDAACLRGTRAAEASGAAILVGKTNLHELAFGVTGINPWFGTPVNPRDPALVPGGSSSGSAAAVASGEADVAFGTDTGGSVRIPAACCGVVGLKTTRGRVPLAGVKPLAPSLDTVGPLARNVAGVVEGMALLDPGFVAGGPPATVLGRLRLPATDRVDRALDRAIRTAGLRAVDVVLPGWETATRAATTILMAEAWQVHAPLWREHRDGLSPDVSKRLEASSLVGAEEVARCWERARAWGADLCRALDRVDLLALPTLADEPPRIEDAHRLTHMRYGSPFNLAGVPAVSLPVATPAGVPASLQLAGPAGSEALLLATASVLEDAAGAR